MARVRIARRLPLVLVALMIFVARPAEAWNPLKPLASAAKKAGAAIGRGLGGLVESATTPTIRNAEQSGHRLIGDVEMSLDRQLEHGGAVATSLVGVVDKSVGEKLDKVDRSLEARILQVHVAGDELVDRTFNRVDATIWKLDDVAKRRIDQIEKTGKNLIASAGQEGSKLLAQADAVLEKRVGDVRQLVATSLQQADEVAEARITQLDEVAGKRIGSVDVIATKQSLGLEAMLLRIAALVGMVAFLGFVLWRLFVEVTAAWKKALAEKSPNRVWATLVAGSPRFFIQVAFGVAGIAALYFLSGYLPRTAEKRANDQITEHEVALASAFTAYDFTSVRYHSTQLEILKTESAPHYRALARKAELMRTVLGRPALLQSIAGVRQLAAELTEVESALGRPDPDILTLECFVTWQIGTTRRDEYEAAQLCASALELPRDAPGGFMLETLARNYVRAFLYDPYPVDANVSADAVDKLRRLLASPTAAPVESPQFQHVVEYDALVAKLDRASMAAYLDMLDAHVDYVLARGTGKTEPPNAAGKRALRNQHARHVVDAWSEFDTELETSPWLADDPTVLAAFTLDDAVLTRARYFVAVPEATELPPALASEPEVARGAVAKKPDPFLRVRTAPLRIAWAKRYATLVGPKASEVLAIEEAARFAMFERRVIDFERAYVAFAGALRVTPHPDTDKLAVLGTAAIRTASELGCFRDTPEGRRALAAILVDAYRTAGGTLADDVAKQISEQQQRRRIRFL